MRPARRLLPLGLAATALACANPLTPHHVLTGTWTNTTSSGWALQLSASSLGADFSTPCTKVHFPPLELDDSLSFRARGVYTEATGLVAVRIGDAATIAGRVEGDRVIMVIVEDVAVPQGPWKVVPDTLTPGRIGLRICNS